MRGRGEPCRSTIDKEGVYWKKRNIVNTGKWSTGYLTPEGNKMKEQLDKLSIDELISKIKELDIKHKDQDLQDKQDIIHLIIKKKNGISKMKVNNRVASDSYWFLWIILKIFCRTTLWVDTFYKNKL